MENKDNLMQNRLYHINDVATPGEQATKTVFYSTDSTSGSVWLVKPGQVVAPHQHTTSDDLWICVQGKGVFYPEPGIETAISKGDIVLSGKGNCHGMRNTGDEDFIFVSVLGPVPADYKHL